MCYLVVGVNYILWDHGYIIGGPSNAIQGGSKNTNMSSLSVELIFSKYVLLINPEKNSDIQGDSKNIIFYMHVYES